MKFKNALIFTILLFMINTGWTIYHYMFSNHGESIFIQSIIFTGLLLPMVWWIGSRIDKINVLHRELHQTKAELESLFNNNSSFLWTNDLIMQQVLVSKGVEQMYGYTAKEFAENYDLWNERIHQEDQEKANELFKTLLSGHSGKAEFRIIQKGGELRWVEVRANPIFNTTGRVAKLNGVAHDITERKLLEERLKQNAYHDSLTGLPNRNLLNEELEESLVLCKINNTQLALMLLDLDRFKFINDTMGHEMGDELLKQVSGRLVKCVRDEDVVARHGGDEFIILLKDIHESQVRDIAERIVDVFKKPFLLDNQEFFTSPSTGISLYPQDGEDKQTLIRHADSAMYSAKKRGKNTYQFFILESERSLDRKVKLEQGLRKALDNQELMLHYQPQIELDTGEWKGVEALLRWNHPEFGLVSPLEFIPIAEETGLIVPIGKWVIEKACKQNKEWQNLGLSPLRVAVNVSSIQFQDRSFIKTVEQILHQQQLSPEYLELEITESVMQDVMESSMILQQLKQLGVKTSIDDFGTGYSSLNVLNRLPIDFVKIDKSFVQEMTTNSNTAFLVKTIIDMGVNLKFELVAEGIETREQADYLNRFGCRFGQGFLFSPPIPEEEIRRLLDVHVMKQIFDR